MSLSFTLRDPYAHLPQLGQMDLHLAGEGRHERERPGRTGHHCLRDVRGCSLKIWNDSRTCTTVASRW